VANSQKSHILFHHGIKVGIIGIVEQEWLDTIRDLPAFVQVWPKSEGRIFFGNNPDLFVRVNWPNVWFVAAVCRQGVICKGGDQESEGQRSQCYALN
jgi:hypothetical protein